MKVGIITVHHNTNYGANLQAYALQQKLCELGHESKLINYANPDGETAFHLFRKSLFDSIRVIFYLKKRRKRISNFKDFANKHYKLTKKIMDFKDLNEAEFDFDVYVTGSDQTFNLKLCNEPFDVRKQYFLPWVKQHKKISYAASMGESIEKLSVEETKWVKNALSEYSYISVRENAAADFMQTIGLKRPEVVIDPTLLLEQKSWDCLAEPTQYDNDKYILFYSVLSEPWVIKKVNQIAEKLNLKVIAPHMKNRFELATNFIRAEEYGPGGFISLIKNAEFVCTTSFHGTVFSILYNKPFVSLLVGTGTRIKNILSLLGLEKHGKCKDDIIDVNELKKINFCEANRILRDARNKSLDVLSGFLKQ